MELAGGTEKSAYTYSCGLSPVQYSGTWELRPGQASYLTGGPGRPGEEGVLCSSPVAFLSSPPSTIFALFLPVGDRLTLGSSTAGCFSHGFQDFAQLRCPDQPCNTFPSGPFFLIFVMVTHSSASNARIRSQIL